MSTLQVECLRILPQMIYIVDVLLDRIRIHTQNENIITGSNLTAIILANKDRTILHSAASFFSAYHLMI